MSDATIIQARKQHRCSSCRKTIDEGESYVRVWSSEGAKRCLNCNKNPTANSERADGGTLLMLVVYPEEDGTYGQVDQ